jgi:hypothetical protein
VSSGFRASRKVFLKNFFAVARPNAARAIVTQDVGCDESEDTSRVEDFGLPPELIWRQKTLIRPPEGGDSFHLKVIPST